MHQRTKFYKDRSNRYGGDFNVRFQLAADPDSRRLSDVLSSFNMVQHVSGSTHRCGNTLDLVMTLVGAAPAYLADDRRLLSDVGRRPLRSNSNDTRKLLVPRTHNKLGDRSFSAAGPRLWNDLPPRLRRPRNSYPRVCCVFAARAASACHWSWTAMGDDPRPTEGDGRLRGTREPLQRAS